MQTYAKPVITILPETTEGIYAASGSNSGDSNTVCRFGQKKFKKHSRICQSCARSGGISDSGYNFGHEGNVTITCIDNIPSGKN